jgi:hypothetical protein
MKNASATDLLTRACTAFAAGGVPNRPTPEGLTYRGGGWPSDCTASLFGRHRTAIPPVARSLAGRAWRVRRPHGRRLFDRRHRTLPVRGSVDGTQRARSAGGQRPVIVHHGGDHDA